MSILRLTFGKCTLPRQGTKILTTYLMLLLLPGDHYLTRVVKCIVGGLDDFNSSASVCDLNGHY